MSQSEQLALSTPTFSITNFNLPSLHLLHQEIVIILKNAEFHLSEFYNDKQRAPLLLDSIEVLKQLSRIFELIALKGAQVLSGAIEDGLQQLYAASQHNDSSVKRDLTDTALLMDLSEAIMTCDRYIEFVLLTETVEPTLLLPIINKLYSHTNQSAIDESYFSRFNSSSVVIANPEQNFEPLSDLSLDNELLTRAYRSGLAIVLTNKGGTITPIDRKKVEAMSAACALIATQSDSLFWQAANALVADIEAILPLNICQKHTLIYLEQQFHSYLPIVDTRYADLVSLACQRDHAQAQRLCEQYANNRLDATQREQMKRFLFGPNRQVIDTLNDLVQTQINTIKEKIDNYSRGDFSSTTLSNSKAQAKQISNDLVEMSSTLRLINLNAAAASLQSAAQAVLQWQKPTPADFDHLLLALMSAENAAIAMAKMHTPSATKISFNNHSMSLHKLNSAYDTLIKESRNSLADAEKAINNYSIALERDVLLLQDVPHIMSQVSGAIRFLQLSISAPMLNQLAKFLTRRIEAKLLVNDDMLAYIADVIMSVDYYLANSEQNRPVVKKSLEVAQHSLSQLLATE